jgi:type VI secretion system secreted protein Hcp
MSVDFFMKVAGVDGESKDTVFPKWIEIVSWSMGGSNTRNGHVSGGGGAGKISVRDVTVTEFTNAASPSLFKFCCIGQKIATVEIAARKAGDTPQVYLKIKLTDVLVSSFHTNGQVVKDRQGISHTSEEVSFNFAKIEMAYGQQDEKGKVNALDKKMSHDLRTDK